MDIGKQGQKHRIGNQEIVFVHPYYVVKGSNTWFPACLFQLWQMAKEEQLWPVQSSPSYARDTNVPYPAMCFWYSLWFNSMCKLANFHKIVIPVIGAHPPPLGSK